MLSAVAARKARLEGRVSSVVSPAPVVLPIHESSPFPTGDPASARKPPSKRKPKEQAFRKPKKKTKQQYQHVEEKRTRYFQEDAFKTQEDVIIVDDEDSDVSQDDISVDGDPGDDGVSTPQIAPFTAPVQPLRAVNRKRAWSPSAPLPDSSDDDENDRTGEWAEPPDLTFSARALNDRPRESPIPTSFQPILDQNTFHLTLEEIRDLNLLSPQLDKKGTLLALSGDVTVTLLGTYTLTILRGHISIAGVTLSASRSPHCIFAPRSFPLPTIHVVSNEGPDDEDIVDFSPRLSPAALAADAVVLLQELQTGVEGLGLVCRSFDGFFSPARWQAHTSMPDLGVQGVHLVTHVRDDLPLMTVPQSWEDAMSAVLHKDVATTEPDYSRHVYLIRGPKNSGKSTFARMLLNRLVTRYRRVAYLECDLGQSEFTPGGMVALNIIDKPVFGPPFTHPSLPHTAHYIGAASPRSSPSHYLDSIHALVQSYNFDIQHAALLADTDDNEPPDGRIVDVIPLVVNTMGWTKGLGADLLRKAEALIEPSDIFELEVQIPGEAWAAPGFFEPSRSDPSVLEGPRVHRVQWTSPAAPSHYTPADHRTLSLLSYFHAVFPADADPLSLHTTIAASWNTALPLCAQPPYEVDAKIAFDGVVLAGTGMEDVVPTEVRMVLNGALVGLVCCEPGTLDADEDAAADDSSGLVPYKQGVSPPSPLTSTCRGLALIRAVAPSPASPLMHVLTPLPPSFLDKARLLVKGELELPVWGMLDFRTGDSGDVAGVERGKVPYLRWGKGEGLGGDRRRVRRNLMRRAQIHLLHMSRYFGVHGTVRMNTSSSFLTSFLACFREGCS
ncbi:hypothetical protein AcV7_007695 [Taiwanofungus camphoratus]|nr:hypothetical protein AcV7_007695 [Antrodia cinnamomea]